jgi:hypothetical protein
MMAELDPGGGDAFCTIDADGSFAQSGRAAALGGSEESVSVMVDKLRESGHDLPLEQALGAALEAWGLGRLTLDAEDGESPGDEAVREFLRGGLEGFKVEAAVLDRDRAAKSKFSLLAADDLAASLSAHVGAEPP